MSSRTLDTLTLLETEEDLKEHLPMDDALLRISAPLVPGIWILERGRANSNPMGEMLRGIELLLVGVGERDTQLLMAGCRQTSSALLRIIADAQMLPDAVPEIVEAGEAGEEEDDPGNEGGSWQ